MIVVHLHLIELTLIAVDLQPFVLISQLLALHHRLLRFVVFRLNLLLQPFSVDFILRRHLAIFLEQVMIVEVIEIFECIVRLLLSNRLIDAVVEVARNLSIFLDRLHHILQVVALGLVLDQ